jgi:dTDP-4-dehydrorhamnose 3,5-epimerase
VLPEGVGLRPLDPHADERGVFTELHRIEWETGVAPVQWNLVHSAAGVLRGVHVHPRHDDYLVVVAGRATVGLRDLRDGAPEDGRACCLELDGGSPAAITIPHGVAHGFYFHEPSIHIYAVSHYWDTSDELGCHWADPDLGIPWPARGPRVSARDEALLSLAELRLELARAVGLDG